jgi:Zn-finger nucleic acid-binding protein
MNCDKCGAPVRIDSASGLAVCDHCGGQNELSNVLQHLEMLGETATLCPTCGSPLSDARVEGHPLLCCARCFGMLIAMNRFVAVIEAVRAQETRTFGTAQPRRQNPDERRISCPTCGQAMVAHLYGGPGNVVIDTCERCLVNWLDSGELRRIAVAPDRPQR